LGWGDTLRSLFNFAKPLFRKGAEFLGRKAVDTVANIAHDAISGDNVKESAKRRLVDTGQEIFAKAPEAVVQLMGNKSKKQKRSAPSTSRAVGKKRRKIGHGIMKKYPALGKII
jgi:hypothetical protein